MTSDAALLPRPPAPPLARLGLVLPGLGHLLTGRAGTGLVMLVYLGVLLLAAIEGFPRLGALLFPPATEGGFSLHPWVAICSWVAAAVLLWRAAVHHAFPASVARDASPSQRQLVIRQFRRSHMGMAGLQAVLLLALLTLLTPLVAPFDPDRIDAGPHLAAPSLAHPCGTDLYGRDVYSRLLYGARISLTIGFLAVAISATFGAMWGAVSGFFGGKIDHLMMWGVDFLALPRLVLLLAIIGLYRPRGASGIYLIVLILGLTGWMGVSRIVRGMVLSLKQQDFVQAARALGQSQRLIIFRHLLPNAIAPVIVHATLGIGATILTEATLSFLGLGVPPPTATWGSIVNEGREFLRVAPWIVAFPGALIVAAVMSFNLLGDGLRDALDPKLRNR